MEAIGRLFREPLDLLKRQVLHMGAQFLGCARALLDSQVYVAPTSHGSLLFIKWHAGDIFGGVGLTNLRSIVKNIVVNFEGG